MMPATAKSFASLLFAATLVSASGCDVGSGPGGGGGGDEPDATPGSEVDASPQGGGAAVGVAMVPQANSGCTGTGASIACNGELGATFMFDVTATSTGGFAGDVTLSAGTLPANWTATFAPATVTLTDGGTANSVLTVRVGSNGAVGAQTLAMTTSSSAPAANWGASFTVANIYTARVTDTCTLPNSPGGTAGDPIRLPAGAAFRMLNATGGGIIIHADGQEGFPHQDTGAVMAVNDYYEVTPPLTGTVYEWYCHQPDMGQRSYVRFD